VEALLADPSRGRYYVAEAGGETVGQLLVTTEWSDWRNAEVWWIQSVYVSRRHRREGIYRALHDEVREAARSSGAAGLRLYVDRDNRAAKETYETLGMRRSHYRMYEEMWK
jgi:ribosomal protein S18 acetylase RimI-like enzyme